MTPTHMDRKTFLANLRQSGLLGADELRTALEDVPETERGRVVARALVRQGLLTKFQAELLLIGRTHGFLLGQYRVLDQLGQGGMGRVFKAVHQTMHRTVALKVLAPNLLRTEKAHDLFLREVRAAGQLLHPNIVTAYDANQINGRHYLVMEYVDGPSLDQLVRDNGPLPVGLACEIIRQAALGLQFAAQKGMVHRDIKPSNLLIQRQGPTGGFVVKILDFGLARLHGSAADGPATDDTPLPKEHTVMGTPDFLSPEQARNLDDVDSRADLYSLGCTFYYLLTGQVPFPGGTSLEKLIRHCKEEPAPIEESRPDMPPAVAAALRRLMAKDAADRFQTPAELAAALAPFAFADPAFFVADRETAGRPGSDVAPSPEPNFFADLGSSPSPLADSSAMASTIPPDLLPTVTAGSGLSTSWFGRHPDERRVFLRALLWSVGIVAGLVGLLFLLLRSV
jgi:serine/threonine protein kinase